MPVVPSMEIPPVMPSRPLNVFCCDHFPVGHGDRHHCTLFSNDRPHCLFDHLPRHRIDRRFSHRQFQPFSSDRPHTSSGTKLHGSGSGKNLHRSRHQTAVGFVRIVAAVFLHTAGIGFFCLYFQMQQLSCRHFQFDPLRTLAGSLPQH